MGSPVGCEPRSRQPGANSTRASLVVLVTVIVAALLGFCAVGVGALATSGADPTPIMILLGGAAAAVFVGGLIVASRMSRREEPSSAAMPSPPIIWPEPTMPGWASTHRVRPEGAVGEATRGHGGEQTPIPGGAQVRLEEQRWPWAQISDGSGRTYWINAQHLDPLS